MSNKKMLRMELINEAVLDSKEKAEKLAKTLGMNVKGVESLVTNNNFDNYDIMEHEGSLKFLSDSSLKSNELKSKDTMIHETVEVKWILE